MNQREEEFGEQRLMKIMQANLNRSAEQMIQSIIKEVLEYSKGVPQLDDMTLVVMKRQYA